MRQLAELPAWAQALLDDIRVLISVCTTRMRTRGSSRSLSCASTRRSGPRSTRSPSARRPRASSACRTIRAPRSPSTAMTTTGRSSRGCRCSARAEVVDLREDVVHALDPRYPAYRTQPPRGPLIRVLPTGFSAGARVVRLARMFNLFAVLLFAAVLCSPRPHTPRTLSAPAAGTAPTSRAGDRCGTVKSGEQCGEGNGRKTEGGKRQGLAQGLAGDHRCPLQGARERRHAPPRGHGGQRRAARPSRQRHDDRRRRQGFLWGDWELAGNGLGQSDVLRGGTATTSSTRAMATTCCSPARATTASSPTTARVRSTAARASTTTRRRA